VRWVTKTRVGLTNRALADLSYRNLAQVGPPRYDDTARAFGQAIQKNLGLDPMENPFLPDNETLTGPRANEERVRALLPAWQQNSPSDAYVESPWHAPTVRLFTARAGLRPGGSVSVYPAWVHNALGGVRECVDPGLFVAGQTIAATLVDLLTQPNELAQA